ncbi:MAG: polar amino acid transporter, inner rane subunit, partial [Ramlibacter sp.]|nr:polar amino acid transporter, inner rane subunit [Ramlibacter sp.]
MAATPAGLDQFVFTFLNAGIAAQYAGEIARGMGVTALLSAAVVVAGVSLGLLLAVLRSLQRRALNLLVIAFADILRSLPPLVINIVLFFGCPFL